MSSLGAAPSNTSRSAVGARKRMTKHDLELAEKIGEFYADPYGFVLFAFPWGKPGTRLEKQTGPDTWQIEVMEEIGEAVKTGMTVQDALPVLEAVASGHGIGKTALIAWIILWFIATRQHPQIIVTAGKKDQLTGKTWRELAKWHKMCLCGHWFHWTATQLEHVLFPETWFAHAIPGSKSAPENVACALMPRCLEAERAILTWLTAHSCRAFGLPRTSGAAKPSKASS